jgi:hypothetical protein
MRKRRWFIMSQASSCALGNGLMVAARPFLGVPTKNIRIDSQTELNCARRVHLRSHNAEGWIAQLGVWRANRT